MEYNPTNSSKLPSQDDVPDGLDALRAELSLSDIMRLIERTARWVDPATFRLLPVWFPEIARRAYLYNKNWTTPRMNTNRVTGVAEHKREGNTSANTALTLALGLRSKERPNWTCCHIWGVDDAAYQKSNDVVQDPRYFSCVANMVLLPVPLKAFTDAMPEVKAMLRICAFNLYNWHCDHESLSGAFETLKLWSDWSAYPASWPKEPKQRLQVKGIIPLNDRIRLSAIRRLRTIRIDLKNAGQHYPRDQVKRTLEYWQIPLA